MLADIRVLAAAVVVGGFIWCDHRKLFKAGWKAVVEHVLSATHWHSTLKHRHPTALRRRCSLVEYHLKDQESSSPAEYNREGSSAVAGPLPVPNAADTDIEPKMSSASGGKSKIRLGCSAPALPLPAPDDRKGAQEVAHDGQLRQVLAIAGEEKGAVKKEVVASKAAKSQLESLPISFAPAESNASAQHLLADETKDEETNEETIDVSAGHSLMCETPQRIRERHRQERDAFEHEKKLLLTAFNEKETQLRAAVDEARGAAETQRVLQSKLDDAENALMKASKELGELRRAVNEGKEQRKAGLEERRVLQNVLREREREATSAAEQLKVCVCVCVCVRARARAIGEDIR